jgi:hypothetical protein
LKGFSSIGFQGKVCEFPVLFFHCFSAEFSAEVSAEFSAEISAQISAEISAEFSAEFPSLSCAQCLRTTSPDSFEVVS